MVAKLWLITSYHIWFWLNQGLILAILALFRGWFRAPWWVLGGLLLTFTPITDAKMGQASVIVLALAVAGLWWRNGVLVGAAAMAKMSPALYLVPWAVQRAKWPVLAAMATAVLSSVVALIWIDGETQRRFYTEVLPTFATGQYHGLTVRISLPANHSIPDLLNQVWPGPDKNSLAPTAARTGKGISLGLLLACAWLARRRTDRLGEAGLFGAVTVLMLITPVYTYEHHLVMALFHDRRGCCPRRWTPGSSGLGGRAAGLLLHRLATLLAASRSEGAARAALVAAGVKVLRTRDPGSTLCTGGLDRAQGTVDGTV